VKDRLRLPLTFDAAAMRADLRRIEPLKDEAWVRHFVTQNYEGDWTVLPLRAPATATHPVQMIYSDPSCDAYADTPLLAACPAIAAALTSFACPLESVRLMRLGAGSIIKTHTDHDLDVEHGRVRLHVPIETNDGVDFRLNGEQVVLGEGECWYLRLSDPHSVANRGDRDRIHLVIDAIVSPWLYELLETVDAASPQLPAVSSQLPAAGSQLPAASSRLPVLPEWVPARVHAGSATVEWCEIGDVAFTDPFFDATIRRAERAGVATTPIDVLLAEAAGRPGVAPAAFIFHCSRCGSTLMSQLARALPGTLVLSEAPPIDDVLRSGWTDDTRIERLRAVVTALGQRRAGADRHLVIKFDAWHIVDLPLVQRAFPGVPCAFVYRDPLDVVASHMRMPARYLLPGELDPAFAGLASVDDVRAAGREGYCARVIGRMLAAGAELAADGRLDLLNYSELPGAAIDRALAWTGRASSSQDRARLLELAAFDAKAPGMPFAAARVVSGPVSDAARAAASTFASAPFAALERLRTA
jgi:aspartyl/asparaginyl beta-hydroxylase